MTRTSFAELALDPLELGDITELHAERFRAGDYPFVAFESGTRWHRRVHRDEHLDVWLLTWLPTQSTELHDHGGSSGAFTVVAGELTELLPQPADDGSYLLRGHRWSRGSTTVFGPRHVHDVVNRGRVPAVSVHAYSPPLTSMRYYSVDCGPGLSVTRTVLTDEPEPVPASVV
jgi:hypothetical protein